MRNYHKVLGFLGLQLLSVACNAHSINVGSVQYATQSPHTRILFHVSSSPKHRVFVLDNPSRLVVDIKNANLGKTLNQPAATHPLFSRVRAAAKNDTDLRVVIDLKKPISSKNFSLSSNNHDDHQLIIDLLNKEPLVAEKTETKEAKLAAKSKEKPISSKKIAGNIEKPTETKKVAHKTTAADAKTLDKKAKSIVVAIDAGHGGDDPGAHGPHGTEEKNITFAIAKKLEKLINNQPGMKAVMVRKGDYYVGLRNRMKIARAAKADLFISIHADAFEDANVSGASVYTLSRSGASNEAARWLAKSENAADLVGGVSLDDKEDVLASVLIDLSQTATQKASFNVANHVLKNFQHIGELHNETVQKAEFLVLKSPDIPSILVETAYISNPLEEQNLLSARYQSKMANAIFKGVHNYFFKSKDVESRMAAL
ncbi:MAG: N-acetylmuramoyl-L-alanine amidase [Methylococcaceae bacterium]